MGFSLGFKRDQLHLKVHEYIKSLVWSIFINLRDNENRDLSMVFCEVIIVAQHYQFRINNMSSEDVELSFAEYCEKYKIASPPAVMDHIKSHDFRFVDSQ